MYWLICIWYESQDKVTPGLTSNQDWIRQYGIGTGSSQKTKESLKEDEDLSNMDPDQLGVITEVIDEIQDVDEDGRIITEKTEDIEVMVRFDGHQADLLCLAGQVIYDQNYAWASTVKHKYPTRVHINTSVVTLRLEFIV